MRDESYEQMSAEADNWLKVGRGHLLRTLLTEHANDRGGLQILEIGAGVGQNVPILQEFGEVDVLEINPLGLTALRKLEGVRHVFDHAIPAPLQGPYDVVIALDVLEHLADDHAAAAWVASLLSAGGVFVATVPAYQWLFGDHDRALDHYRRYTRRRLVSAMPPELEVRQAGYFVTLLFPIAVVMRLASSSRRVFKSRRRGAGSNDAGRKQSAAVPARVDGLFLAELRAEAAIIGRGIRLPFGLSAFAVARKGA
ncbi:hypothetical protein ASC64_19195 [Nocardioides sp. Root122]|uniref:class I SAM-dependent methyltransferase n=1 Tax=Nocardioides TaxID=1839 RepID=UPI00070319ED|nr:MULTISPECIES: methyltransferase domain-containing protein [Nocardioides]KQV72777.1 hypothetical protein ASC64_19195 [Nocardioides sp. Root122]MCK9825328.1 class I SAM-dependent methyltransferase [Nocardioides cavernae]